MPSYPPSRIRNVALVGHNGSGKTTLAEALLVCAGVLGRRGRVEDGSTVCDFEPEEAKRQMSVKLALAPFTVGDVKVNIIDTPGFADFFSEVRAALSVADLAVVVVSAVEGIEAQSEAVWDLAAELGLARMVFVNKLDRERASFDRTLDQLRERFGAGIAPLELPVGEEQAFRGVADLLTDEAIVYEGAERHRQPIPAELADIEHQVREQLVEGIVVGDDALMERYLDGDMPTPEELEATLATGMSDGLVFPVVCGSAITGVGVDRLASLIAEIGPSPGRRAPYRVVAGGNEQAVSCDPAGPPLAVVFKTLSDPYVGRISLLRAVSGILRPDVVLTNPRTHGEVRLHLLHQLRGKEADPLPEVQAGDLFAVPKLTDVATGDTLAPKGTPVTVLGVAEPELATLAVAIRPKSKGDEDKLMTGLHRLQEEDPSLVVERIDETHQTVLRGLGDTHLAVVCDRLQRKFGVEVETEEVRVPYRETITRSAAAEGKYKKQTGGHGQFGVATIRVEPRSRGEGFEFVDAVVGGAIPKQFIPAVEKGVVEAMSAGGPHGFPVVDLAVTCLDGKHHPVDSSEMSFKMAGSLALREALSQAGTVVLEPISRLEVTVPATTQGDVLGDLNARRGRVQGTDAASPNHQVITALVPTAEIQRYAVDLRALTGGRGRFRAEHDHYDVLPAHLVDKVAGSVPAPTG
ncbi:MAG: elongation factor G [Actinomycetota bacterium]|jgi:elongation factor G|nr:elongation factor G [Actinomycetota bacterium]